MPYHNAQSRAAWREGSGLPRPSQTDRSPPGQQDKPRAIYTYPPEPPEFNRPRCLGCRETCTKDSGRPHPHLSGVPAQRGPCLCPKRDTAPTTKCALRPSGGEGARPSKQSSGLPRPVRIPGPNGAHLGVDTYVYTTTPYAIALTPAHSHQCRDTHTAVVAPPPPWYSRGIPANARQNPMPMHTDTIVAQGNNPRAIYIVTPTSTPRTRASATGATQGAARTQQASAPRP